MRHHSAAYIGSRPSTALLSNAPPSRSPRPVMAHCWERIEEELWKWADVFPPEHIRAAAVQFHAAKQHQEYALQQGLLGLRLFSGTMRPNLLPEDAKQRLKATNLVCRDQLVPMILAAAGPGSTYDQDRINNIVAWVSNGDEELSSCLGFSVLRFLQQLRDEPPAWTQRQGRQAARRRRRRANRANPQGASGSEDVAEDPGGQANETSSRVTAVDLKALKFLLTLRFLTMTGRHASAVEVLEAATRKMAHALAGTVRLRKLKERSGEGSLRGNREDATPALHPSGLTSAAHGGTGAGCAVPRGLAKLPVAHRLRAVASRSSRLLAQA
ncbi:hypothetical protein AK812_SmicGene6024 [Symbiodinium microadriaticum]|uniref:Uncharacterized protein n=1 Tax=Symbiodinium microadriaticum TaxID=2951 RepID=A0A1Q9ES72_SYMMI|nr:hypothetical protein AK812_SmicGene6024 [Symbiodinium microadriaticum]